jgi:hypothetical protein
LNRTLLYFSLALILVGLLFGIYLVAFFGFLLLLPALLATSRPPARPSPAPATEAPKHVTPYAEKKPEVVPTPSEPMPTTIPVPVAAVPPPAMPQSYSPPLFPTPLMPSLSLMGTGGTLQMVKEAAPVRQGGQDELVEVGAILVLLKLISG